MPRRLDINLLDPDDPFEVDDGNWIHLHKRPGYGLADIEDMWFAETCRFYEPTAEGDADWLMVGEVPGMILVAPLAPPKSGDVSKCRPIGVYEASADLKNQYLADRG